MRDEVDLIPCSMIASKESGRIKIAGKLWHSDEITHPNRPQSGSLKSLPMWHIQHSALDKLAKARSY